MSQQSPIFMRGSTHPIEELGDGIKRQILGYNHELMMVKIWFATDSIGYVHRHRHSQTTYIESGVFEVMVDGETHILEAGDAFFIEPEKDHGAVCKQAGVLIDVFSPLREDFLETYLSENNNED